MQSEHFQIFIKKINKHSMERQNVCKWLAVTFPMSVAAGQSEMQMTMSMYKVQLVTSVT